jgi:hypothetical protein
MLLHLLLKFIFFNGNKPTCDVSDFLRTNVPKLPLKKNKTFFLQFKKKKKKTNKQSNVGDGLPPYHIYLGVKNANAGVIINNTYMIRKCDYHF